MTYETAKKLKDAGFPQQKICGHTTDGYGMPYCDCQSIFDDGKQKEIYYPTLSELIEQCMRFVDTGISELKLYSASLERFKYDGIKWIVTHNDARDIGIDSSFGSSPSEAVANMWLILNQRKGSTS